jgi:DNA-binding response OmpR family regulator
LKLLLIEDEPMLSKSVAKGLRKRGYTVDCAFDGAEALELYELNSYDLLILDLNLPKISGMEVLRQIRQKDDAMRILILSARNTPEDKIGGLDAGCSDYLTKPFDFGELEARIRSLLRRKFIQTGVVAVCGSLRVDTAAKEVYAGSERVDLTPKEYGILEYLMLHRDCVVPAEELIEHVWESETDLFSNSFKVHMHSLKKKLDLAGGAGRYIMNQRGQGYRIKEEDEE